MAAKAKKAEVEADDAAEDEGAAQAPAKAKKKPPLKLVIIAAAGLLVVGGGGIGAYLYFGKSSHETPDHKRLTLSSRP